MNNTLSSEDVLGKHITDDDMLGQSAAIHVLDAMDEFAQQESIGFFKWNAATVKAYVDYIMRARESDSDEQLQQELNKFENGTLEERYNMYLLHKQNKEQ